jgi:hypothetical protein
MQHTPLPKLQAPAGETTSHGASTFTGACVAPQAHEPFPHATPLCRPSQTQHMPLPSRQLPAAAVASHGPWIFETRRNVPQSHVGEPQTAMDDRCSIGVTSRVAGSVRFAAWSSPGVIISINEAISTTVAIVTSRLK